MTPVTFKQVQGNETWYELVDSKQDYNHAEFKRLQFNSVKKRELTLTSYQKICQFLLSPLDKVSYLPYVKVKLIFPSHYFLLYNHTEFNLTG